MPRKSRLECNRRTLVLGVTAAAACAAAYGVFSDTLVMTAFYPSPMGNYWKLLSTDATTLARDKSFVAVGIDPRKQPVTSKLAVQGNPGGTSELTVTDSNKNPLFYVGQNGAGTNGVGVGTVNPQAAVDVGLAGGLKLAPGGTCASASDAGKIGMIGPPVTPQWCDGSKWQPFNTTGSTTFTGIVCDIDIPGQTCYCVGPSPCACNGGSGTNCYFAGNSPPCPSGSAVVSRLFLSATCSGCNVNSPRPPPSSCSTPTGWASTAPSCMYGSNYGYLCYGCCWPATCGPSSWTTVKCSVN